MMKLIEKCLNPKFFELTKVFDGYINQEKLPSILALVYHNDKIEYCTSLGKADESREITLDSIIRIYSMTKPITVVAALMLMEEGKFNLDDPISNWMPEAKNLRVFAGVDNSEISLEDLERPLTFFDLITHTSGFVYPYNPNHPVDKKYIQLLEKNIYGYSVKKISEEFFKIPLKFQPGSRWYYGYSIDILGYLIELISGVTLDEFFKKRIFQKLNMHDTGFMVPEEKQARFTRVYSLEDDKLAIQADNPEDKYTRKQKFFGGGGGLVSTLHDFLQFALMLLNKGKLNDQRILQEKTIGLMTKDHLTPLGIKIEFDELPDAGKEWIEDHGFGLGVQVKTKGVDKDASGWCGMATTDYWVDPENKVIGIFFTQFMPLFSYPVFGEFRKLAYKGLGTAK